MGGVADMVVVVGCSPAVACDMRGCLGSVWGSGGVPGGGAGGKRSMGGCSKVCTG